MYMNIIKDLGDNVTKHFTQTIPTSDLLCSLLVAVVAVLIINFTYKKTYVGVSYTKTESASTRFMHQIYYGYTEL